MRCHFLFTPSLLFLARSLVRSFVYLPRIEASELEMKVASISSAPGSARRRVRIRNKDRAFVEFDQSFLKNWQRLVNLID